MKRVLKYSISVEHSPMSYAQMPQGLVVAMRPWVTVPGHLDFWMVARDEGKASMRTFRIVGTGEPWEDDWMHRATAPPDSVGGVWHLIEWVPF